MPAQASPWPTLSPALWPGSSALSRQPKQTLRDSPILSESDPSVPLVLPRSFSLHRHCLSGCGRVLRTPGRVPCSILKAEGPAPVQGSLKPAAPGCRNDALEGTGLWDSHWRLFTGPFAWQLNSPQQPPPCQELSGTISPSQRGPARAWAVPSPSPHQPRGRDSHRTSSPCQEGCLDKAGASSGAGTIQSPHRNLMGLCALHLCCPQVTCHSDQMQLRVPNTQFSPSPQSTYYNQTPTLRAPGWSLERVIT